MCNRFVEFEGMQAKITKEINLALSGIRTHSNSLLLTSRMCYHSRQVILFGGKHKVKYLHIYPIIDEMDLLHGQIN